MENVENGKRFIKYVELLTETKIFVRAKKLTVNFFTTNDSSIVFTLFLVFIALKLIAAGPR